jgi:hypothetical protein
MKTGLASLKEAVLKDTKDYNDCFSENGCDHEFTRMMPETNPALIRMGMTKKCVMVSKCSHKYCDKYKWVVERAKHYAEKTGKTFEEIIEIWEGNRTFWYMNYYQDCNQPLKGRSRNDEQIVKTNDRIAFLKIQIGTYDFLSTTLTYEHQQQVKDDLIAKVENMKRELKDCQSRMQLYEISCFAS